MRLKEDTYYLYDDETEKVLYKTLKTATVKRCSVEYQIINSEYKGFDAEQWHLTSIYAGSKYDKYSIEINESLLDLYKAVYF